MRHAHGPKMTTPKEQDLTGTPPTLSKTHPRQVNPEEDYKQQCAQNELLMVGDRLFRADRASMPVRKRRHSAIWYIGT